MNRRDSRFQPPRLSGKPADNMHGNLLWREGIFIISLWFSWFINNALRYRKHLLLTLVCCIFAIALARVLSLAFPFRPRPICTWKEGCFLPAKPMARHEWNSFPSDHAVVFFSLSGGLFYVSTVLGGVAAGYTLFFICLPRVCRGLHYPSDIAGGAVLGVIVSFLGNEFFINSNSVNALIHISYSRPYLFHSALMAFAALFLSLSRFSLNRRLTTP